MPVATPTLRVRDNQDGGNITATIAGSTAGTTNTLWSQQVVNSGAGTWTSLGSRVNDGEVILAPGVGYHWFHAVSTDGVTNAMTNLVYRRVSTGAEVNMELAFAAIVARLQQLELDGINREDIHQQELLEIYTDWTFPCVVVCLVDSTEEFGPGSNITEEVHYPFKIVILDHFVENETKRQQRLRWRSQIIRALVNQKLPGVLQVFKTFTVRPGFIVGNKPPDADLWWSALEVSAWADETRGLT